MLFARHPGWVYSCVSVWSCNWLYFLVPYSDSMRMFSDQSRSLACLSVIYRQELERTTYEWWADWFCQLEEVACGRIHHFSAGASLGPYEMIRCIANQPFSFCSWVFNPACLFSLVQQMDEDSHIAFLNKVLHQWSLSFVVFHPLFTTHDLVIILCHELVENQT